jgi:hypothetical protein
MLITNLEIEAKRWELSYNAHNNGLVPYDFSSPEKKTLIRLTYVQTMHRVRGRNWFKF